MKKKVFSGFIVLLTVSLSALGSYLYFERDQLIAQKIKADLKALTGLEIALEQVKLEKVRGSSDWMISIEKMRVSNPPRFEIPNIALLHHIRVTFNPWGLCRGEWDIRQIRAYLQKVSFHINREGVLNLTKIPAIMVTPEARGRSKSYPSFHVQQMDIKLGKLYLLDFSAVPTHYQIHDFKGQHFQYRNIRDPEFMIQALVLFLAKESNYRDSRLPLKEIEYYITSYISMSYDDFKKVSSKMIKVSSA